MGLALFITIVVIIIIFAIGMSIYSYKFDSLKGEVEQTQRYVEKIMNHYLTDEQPIKLIKDDIKQREISYEAECPICGHYTTSDKDSVYSKCWHCGCKLDWSEVKNESNSK